MRALEVGHLARHAPIVDALRHGDRDARRRGRAAQDGLAMTAIQAHYAQYLVWAARGLAISTLAAHTRTTPANVSQVLTRMEREGLVRRVTSTIDARSKIARITAYGAHQFWLLVRRMQRIEDGYRDATDADASAAGRRLDHVLRPLAGPLPRLLPDLPWRLRRPRTVAPRAP
ncbi:MarR family transcriptional regulator [Demequina sp. NBRC 110056]|uniref:MarR family transcriptional regulator n=1 Tax=Demequina sp. NBRC 110056 TaxID=1570345 RepID=UPI0009FE0C46|nr:MarR family transcriptional regulator [Demequina sp. NBRC 110056]